MHMRVPVQPRLEVVIGLTSINRVGSLWYEACSRLLRQPWATVDRCDNAAVPPVTSNDVVLATPVRLMDNHLRNGMRGVLREHADLCCLASGRAADGGCTPSTTRALA